MPQRVTAVGLVAGLIAAMSSVACGPRQPGATTPPPPPADQPRAIDGKMIIHATKAVRWSSKCDAETRRELETGDRRLSINVNAYEPPTSGAAILVVHLLTANGTKRQEVHRFSVHPNAPFKVSNGVQPKRFLVSLADDAKLIEGSEIHLEVGFDSSDNQLQGGMAEISIAFLDL